MVEKEGEGEEEKDGLLSLSLLFPSLSLDVATVKVCVGQ